MTGEAAVNLAAVGEGMVAGDLVNTASRVQSVAEPGSVFVGEGTRRASERTVVYEAAGSFELKGKEGETPLWRAHAGRLGSRRLAQVGGAGGAVRRPRSRAAPDQGFVPRLCRGGAGAARLGDGNRRDRQVAAWRGSSTSTSTGSPRPCTGIAAAASRTAKGVTYWALADMVRMRCADRARTMRRTARCKSCRRRSRSTCSTPRSDASSSRGWRSCSASARALRTSGRTCSRPGDCSSSDSRTRTRRCSRSRTCSGRTARCSTSSSTCWSGRATSPCSWSRSRGPELLEKRPTWGAGHAQLHLALPGAALGAARCRSCWSGSCPGCRRRCARRSLPGPKASRCTRWRRCGCCSTGACWSRTAPSTRSSARSETLEVPETLHALIAARLDGLATEERRVLGDAAVLGKTFHAQALAALSGLERERAGGAARGLVRREVLGLQSDPRSPEQGQYTFLQDLLPPRRLRDAAQARAAGEAPRRRRAPRPRPSARKRWRRCRLPPARRLPARPRRTRKRGTPSPGARGAPAGRRARCLSRRFQRSPTLLRAGRRARARAAPSRRPPSTCAGEMALAAGETERHGELFEQAVRLYEADRQTRMQPPAPPAGWHGGAAVGPDRAGDRADGDMPTRWSARTSRTPTSPS